MVEREFQAGSTGNEEHGGLDEFEPESDQVMQHEVRDIQEHSRIARGQFPAKSA